MRILNSKKGSTQQGYTPVHLIIVCILFLVMAFFLVFIIGQYIDAFMTQDENLVLDIYAYRAANICLAYQDPITARYYPGVIDYNLFKQDVLNQCYKDTDAHSFNFQLKFIDKDEYSDKILVGFGGSRGTKSYPVLIKRDGNTHKGALLVGVSGAKYTK